MQKLIHYFPPMTSGDHVKCLDAGRAITQSSTCNLIPEEIAGSCDPFTLYYLAYGSNLHPGRLRQRVLWCSLVGQVALPGYQLQFHKFGRDGSGKATLTPTGRPADCAHGAVYRIHRLAKPALDHAEPGYRTIHLEVALGDRQQQVFTYLAEPAMICADLVPFTWYKELVLAGARYHQLPAAYITRLMEVSSIADPDRNRQQHHASLLAALSPALCGRKL